MLLSGRSLESGVSRVAAPLRNGVWPRKTKPSQPGAGYIDNTGYGNPYVQIMTLARNGTMDAAAGLRVSYFAILATQEFATIK